MKKTCGWIVAVMAGLAVAAYTLPGVAAAPREVMPPRSINADDMVSVEINKGVMVKLDQAIAAVMVADPNTADIQLVSPRLIFVRGKRIGQTNVYAVDGNDDMVYSAVVQVNHNLSELDRMVKKVAPEANISVSTVDRGLVLNGQASSPVEAENIRNMASAFLGADDRIVNMIRTEGSDQVSIQVKVVEMARNDLKRFSVNGQALLSPGGLGLQILQGDPISLDEDGIFDRGTSTDSVIYGNWSSGTRSISAFVDALESQGMAHILAEPNLTTMSGKTANFLAGGEFPITVDAGDGSLSVEYKPFGVSLRFTPVVMSKDRISMNVAPEVSTITFDNPVATDGINNPIILTRKAEATVELGSGETFALAGLLNRSTNNTISKFPGLGDVPILGSLFRSTQFQNDLTELVILVTPYIVRPVASKDKMQTPTDGYVPPSQLSHLLYGNLYEQEPMEKEADLPPLHGDGGFMLDEEPATSSEYPQ